jgi:ABC-2 type transport system permease protein
MKAQRIVALLKKNFKMVVREPAMLFMLIVFPVVLCLAFGAAFGALGAGNGSQTYTVGVVNHDASMWSSRFMGNLSATEVLKVQSFPDNETALEKLRNGRLSAVIIIPADFGASIDSYFKDTNPLNWINTTVSLSVDQGSYVAKAAIPPVVQQVLVTTIFGTQPPVQSSVSIGSPALVTASSFTQFDGMVPGLFAFAVIFITMTVAEAVVGEREQRLLRRISVTPTTSGDVITSHLLSNTTISMLQVGLVFLIATLMGFQAVGGVGEIIFAFLIMAAFALCNVGFGLIVASVSKNAGAATGFSMIVILPQMFLGTFVPAPQAISMIVPSYYATDALTSLFLRGASVTSPVIWTDFGIVCVFAVAIIALGVFLYKKFGTR